MGNIGPSTISRDHSELDFASHVTQSFMYSPMQSTFTYAFNHLDFTVRGWPKYFIGNVSCVSLLAPSLLGRRSLFQFDVTLFGHLAQEQHKQQDHCTKKC